MNSVEYPLGTVAAYGPTDKRATKLVAAVFPREQTELAAIRKWVSEVEDIREDPTIQAALSSFFKEHRVARAVVSEEILGCPHEEGIDYPVGTACPACPFWADRPRPSMGRKVSPSKPGRNDPCSCGSGKKFKKCCG